MARSHADISKGRVRSNLNEGIKVGVELKFSVDVKPNVRVNVSVDSNEHEPLKFCESVKFSDLGKADEIENSRVTGKISVSVNSCVEEAFLVWENTPVADGHNESIKGLLARKWRVLL
jgi:hypothetical protein